MEENTAQDLRKKYDYFKKFDCVLAAGLEGYEIPFKETKECRECQEDPESKIVIEGFSDYVNRRRFKEDSDRNRIPLYNKIAGLVTKYKRSIFLPYQEDGFNGIWGKREIEIFRDVLVPEADFVIGDVYDFSELKSLASEKLEEGNNLMLLIEEESRVSDILLRLKEYEIAKFPYRKNDGCPGLYPLIGNDEELLLKFEHFLRQFYPTSNQ